MTAVVNPGSLQQLKAAGSVEQALALKVIDLQETNGKFKCEFSDGKENMAGVITSQVIIEDTTVANNTCLQSCWLL